MNRMQKLGIDTNTVEGIEKLIAIECIDIGDEYGNDHHCKYCNDSAISCERCKAERLLEKVPTKKVKRWETVRSDEDLKGMLNEYRLYCSCCICDNCHFKSEIKIQSEMTCFINYLCEEIKVEPEL